MTDDSTIDPFTGEALLLGHGRVDGDPLSDLLDALGSAPLPSETAGGVSTIGGMVANVSVAVAARAPSSRRRLTTRVGALAVTGSMFLTSVAAAAVGVPVPVISEVVPEVADLVPGGSGSPDPAPGVADESDELEAPTLQDESVVEPTPSGDDGASTEAEEEPGNSQRGRSDCGKPDAEPTGEPECDEAGNHGEYVSDGKPEDPGSNGNGKPEDPGSNGNGKPEDPGANGNGNGQPEDPGSNGNGNGQPEDPGANGNGPDEDIAGGNGNGPDESNAGGNGNGADEGNTGGNGNGNAPDESNAGGNGNGSAPDESNAGGNGNGSAPDESNAGGNGNGNGNGGG